MNKPLTIREFFTTKIKDEPYGSAIGGLYYDGVAERDIKELIEQWVQYALEQAAEKAVCKTVSDWSGDHKFTGVDPKSILNAVKPKEII